MNDLLPEKDRFKLNGELIKIAEKYLGIKIGIIQQLEIKSEVNEPTIVKIKIAL